MLLETLNKTRLFISLLILEKAWDKIHGSYERIEAGLDHNVMRDLTGAPSFDIDIE